ncbi:hypothetical protein [Alienimonas californiensis]|uniref:Uncharacterized protein n=1 Tax=Alienimonas californiensis TaxID=2527989 RepID=A0A517P7A3_9PLAN|nr:hypothetical protein [Alienimonas californiensis]QDT15250.1 hypothetical protein CA12_13330 [Alienimonas californiensis]
MTSLRLRTAALTVAAFLLSAAVAGCFAPPTPAGPAVDPADNALHDRVAAALPGDADAARLYAAFYHLIAERLTAGEWETTGELAAVAGRAAALLGLPGKLSAVVEDELDPVLNPPGPLTGARRTNAAAAFARLADACGEAVR